MEDWINEIAIEHLKYSLEDCDEYKYLATKEKK